MKGLLIKDLRLMKMQKKFFFIVLVLAFGMALLTENTSFLITYITMVISIFALTSFSYDEFENGYAFLFTLPISRRIYVLEKYCFALLLEGASLLIGIVGATVFQSIKGNLDLKELLILALSNFSVMLLFLSAAIPLQIKFGAEKSRIALLILVGALFGLGYLIFAVFDRSGAELSSVLQILTSIGWGWILAAVLLIIVGVLLLSLQISISIIRKKEF